MIKQNIRPHWGLRVGRGKAQTVHGHPEFSKNADFTRELPLPETSKAIKPIQNTEGPVFPGFAERDLDRLKNFIWLLLHLSRKW
ncbi:hypothetical protein AKJ62_00845 [candidate division MSBL1 archaeon SCGC-AAA259D14]|uniref:Uncharacterized protein n=1 Tax=candidate division MSBL1 archaeon SCGC-AAA259D14 TaxID=1698261 RepID=A0A133U8F0_9EURY|nr:hypothetical protein AKJ62_00845 [candidate division MSBL1 archaeon SCGC-AAA259D14]